MNMRALSKTALVILLICFSAAGYSCGGGPAARDDMVFIEGGCYIMGDTLGIGLSNEKPAHRVCLNSFYMDKYEVKQSDFATVMGSNPSKFNTCPDCPVDQAIWQEAHDYCQSLGKRLPTEAEWEYAARERGKDVIYCNGKDTVTPEEVNYGWHAGTHPSPVGSYPPNAMGIYDMCGNVWEWLNDFYDHDYYSKSPVFNPQGPETAERHAIRGGSWDHQLEDLRVTFRWGLLPKQRGYDNGFRCAK